MDSMWWSDKDRVVSMDSIWWIWWSDKDRVVSMDSMWWIWWSDKDISVRTLCGGHDSLTGKTAQYG